MTLRFDANLKWLFTELDFTERFDAAAAAGFTGVEYASPYEHSVSTLKNLLDRAGLEQVLINTPMGAPQTPFGHGLACIPGNSAKFRDGVLLGLEYATALDAPFLHVVGGIIPHGVSRDLAFATYLTNIAWAVEQAQRTQVKVLIEAQNQRDAPGFILESQAQAAAVVEAVGPAHAGVLLDFYHAQITQGDLISTFHSVKDMVLHLQVADPPSRNEPGTGEIGWKNLFTAVSESGYDGWIGCEYRPAHGTLDGLGWIEEMTS